MTSTTLPRFELTDQLSGWRGGSGPDLLLVHGVGLNAHDRAGVGGQQDVRNLGQHGIGQILDHEGHAMGFSPAQTQ